MKSLYVISADGGETKIGVATNPAKRLAGLQTSNGRKLSLVHVESHDRAEYLEKLAHAILKDKRAQGEWFNVTPDEACSAVKEAIQRLESEAVDDIFPERDYDGPRKTMSLRLSAEEQALLDRLVKDRKSNKTAVIVAGLQALDGQNDLTQAEVIAWIQRHTPSRKVRK